MKVTFTVLATLGSLVLAFCIAAAITAQASHTWWEIEKNGSTRYYFGLYQVCTHDAVRNETCYKMDVKGVKEFVNKEIVKGKAGKVFPVVEAENYEGQNTWILAFFAILFTGMAFILSVPTACLSYSSNIYKYIPKLLALFTFTGTILGITSVAYAFDQRSMVWPTGVKALQDEGLVTGKVEFVGRGFLFQCLYSAIEVIAFVIYIVMIKIHPDSKEIDI